MQVSHSFAAGSAVFDDEHLVSYAGLVPVMTLAEPTGLSRLLGEKVHIAEPRIKSGAANPVPEAGYRGCRHVRGRGLYRRHRRGPQRGDDDAVRWRVRALDGGNVSLTAAQSVSTRNTARFE